MRKDFPYLMPDTDRHGNGRVYVRRYGKKVRIEIARGTPEFAAAYVDALVQLEKDTGRAMRRSKAEPETVGWLAEQWFASSAFSNLPAASQRVRRTIIEDCLGEPVKPGAKALMRNCPLARFTSAAVMMLMERKARQNDIDFTERVLLSLVVDISLLRETVDRIRVQVFAMAKKHGIEPPS